MQQMQQVAKYYFAQEPFSNRHTAHEKLVATREPVAPSCMMGSMARTESLFELPIFTRAAWPYMSVTLLLGINLIMNTVPMSFTFDRCNIATGDNHKKSNLIILIIITIRRAYVCHLSLRSWQG